MKINLKCLQLCLPAILLAGSVLPAHAQWDSGAAVDMTGMGILAMEDAVMDAARETVTRKSVKRSPAPKPTTVSRLAYKPSLLRRKANMAQFVAKARAKNPQAGNDLEKMLSGQDVIAAAHREMSTIGLRPNNVADAYAAWWINAWQATRGQTNTPPRSQIAAVRQQAAQTMSRVPGIVSGSDATKQQVAEAYLVQAVLIGGMMQGAKGNPAQLQQIASSVRKGAAASGLNLDSMELTNTGFQSRG